MSKWYPPEKEMEYKKRFVEEDLTDLMQALDDQVLQCIYYNNIEGKEFVVVKFMTSSSIYCKEIEVTADSLSAIVLDVVRRSGV